MMKAKNSSAVATSAFKLLPACLFAAAVAFGISPAPVAGAEPSDLVWDIEAYDDCMNKTVSDANQCCVDSGGIPTDEPLGDRKGQKCEAPPAQQQAEPLTPPEGLGRCRRSLWHRGTCSTMVNRITTYGSIN